MLDAVRKLMNACESSGEIRPGAEAEDFLMLVGLFWRIPPTSARFIEEMPVDKRHKAKIDYGVPRQCLLRAV
jgi:hypothetical protein